ncbi:Rv3235 family protein [Streptomonospora nanhaiensis]|uniref:Rv3235 family protein n=1 Tax=Streptomonospora nanhaiensis TaxID=1323731 RepID=A0ABY6YW88_9ACTN|nr:Rv3235 family protein [Streptomonospora nanhaiensis]WAE76130.1 Rv3235 family protein [Streptomonospora nanhaiensis]
MSTTPPRHRCPLPACRPGPAVHRGPSARRGRSGGPACDGARGPESLPGRGGPGRPAPDGRPGEGAPVAPVSGSSAGSGVAREAGAPAARRSPGPHRRSAAAGRRPAPHQPSSGARVPGGRPRPARTPARAPLAGAEAGRCAAGPLLAGHRTPGEVYLLAQRLAEVLVGRRAPEVLRDQLAVPVREELRRLRGAIPCGLAPRLGRVFHQRADAGGSGAPEVEASAVIGCARRSRVFAFRARRVEGRWVCVRLETDSAVRSRTGVPVVRSP